MKTPESKLAAQRRYNAKHKVAIAARRTARLAAKGDEIRAHNREYYVKNVDRFRDDFLRRRYGITQVDYDAMLAAQGGVCAVHGGAEWGGPGNRPHVDHDHITKKVRGLVCVRCNVLLGMARDCPERLTNAIAYLEKHCS